MDDSKEKLVNHKQSLPSGDNEEGSCFFAELSVDDMKDDAANTRCYCEKCFRPSRVCWCHALPQPKVKLKNDRQVLLLQHPYEQTRRLSTGRMLELALESSCDVRVGRRFNHSKTPDLIPIFEEASTVLLYPGPDAVDLTFLDKASVKTIIVLDGTWSQAQGLYSHNPLLHKIRKVSLSNLAQSRRSEYIVRTQPAAYCLSTVECVAISLAHLESRPELEHLLIEPLRVLCNFQLQFGEAIHHDRETLIQMGQYNKPVGKRTRKRLGKDCSINTE